MRVILVMGIESSGTSAVAGTLHHLGVYMGARLHRPSKTNPKGYYEDADWSNFVSRKGFWSNKKPSAGEYIDKRLSQGKKIWGVKSPAFSTGGLGVLFVSALKEKIPDLDLRMVVVSRSPESIMKSVYAKRMGNISHKDARRRVDNSLERLRNTVNLIDCPKLNIKYDSLCFYTEKEVRRMAVFCFDGMDFPQLDGAIEFVDSSLNHYPGDKCI